MANIVGVRFKDVGKIYYFDPDGKKLNKGDHVIVETGRGVECGEIAMANRVIPDSDINYPLKKLIRIATEADLKVVSENKEKEKRAFDICVRKIQAHNLKMKLVNVEYTFDNNKILFYFTADGRVDFRELVKDLAYIFRTRIELRQIGVRDEAKMLGGLGICGRRLMCCLKYEQDAYSDLLKTTPKTGAIVNTPDGKGTVTDMNLIMGKLTVSLHKAPEAAAHIYNVSDVTVIKDSQIKVEKSEMEKLKKLEK